jgi:hypothetical protein
MMAICACGKPSGHPSGWCGEPHRQPGQPMRGFKPIPDDKPVLVGETNPLQGPDDDPDHYYDLWPDPPNASGGRFARIIARMDDDTYKRTFTRRNLMTGEWSFKVARPAAEVLWRATGTTPLILLGQKVAKSFGLPFFPFTCIEHGTASGLRKVVIIPHPSGANFAWRKPGAYKQAQDVVAALLRSMS